jgi:3-phosphoshikimate 1-carboxyvinyltransferase
MELHVRPSSLSGSVAIPGSKSHTIRALLIGSLAEGTSSIVAPLDSEDTSACVAACRAFGAEIDASGDAWTVTGVGGKPAVPDEMVDVGNSGTTLYLTMGTAGLVDGWTVFTGDSQIRSRPAEPLLDALRQLGCQAKSKLDNGCPPLVVRGPMHGGEVRLDGSKTSQYVSSLLLNCPLAVAPGRARGDTILQVDNPVELPYIGMTLGWLRAQGISVECDGYERFRIPGGQRYRAFTKRIPADFSSATFFLCAAAVTRSELTLVGLDMTDTQGDKAVVEMLAAMGAETEQLPNGVRIRGGALHGAELDLNATPDALPALAVTACFAEGETRLVNVAQARLKETDRLRVMREELTKLGGDVEELPDGLVVRGRPLKGAAVHGHHDHRVVMALAVAGLAAEGTTTVDTAEAAAVTFPSFVELMQSVGAGVSVHGAA